MSEYDDRTDAERKREETYCELECIRLDMGRAPGWTAHAYREMFGEWPEPSLKACKPMMPSHELLKWVRARDRAFLKARRAEAGLLNDRDAQKAFEKKMKRGKGNGSDGRGALSGGASSVKRTRRH